MATFNTQSLAATTQSWAAWLLDSYASSVSSPAIDTSFPHYDDSESPPEPLYDDSELSISMSSAYGPTLKTDCRGAVNLTGQTGLKVAPRSASLVDLGAYRRQQPQTSIAERRNAAARLEAINTQDTLCLRRNSAQYLDAGRCGAGNYVLADAKPIQRSPSLPVSFISFATSNPSSPKNSNLYPVDHHGRGGAVNYSAATQASKRAETGKEQAARLRREQVVEEVEGLIKPPPGAWLGGGRRKSDTIFDDV